MDVLRDNIRAEGKYPIGFQPTRSVRNDILERQFIFHATGSKRRAEPVNRYNAAMDDLKAKFKEKEHH